MYRNHQSNKDSNTMTLIYEHVIYICKIQFVCILYQSVFKHLIFWNMIHVVKYKNHVTVFNIIEKSPSIEEYNKHCAS